jgi:hypothetical protein
MTTIQPTRYELIFEDRPDYLYARITSDSIDDKMVLSYVQEVIDECRRTGNERVLIDRNIPKTLSNSDTFFTGAELAKMGIGQIRLALVDSRRENDQPLGLAMLVIKNRGGRLEHFRTVEEAEKWLIDPHRPGTKVSVQIPLGLIIFTQILVDQFTILA